MLNNITALEFTNTAAGPYAGYLLSEWGADVIKVEPPDGASERHSGVHHHYVGNRGKQSIAIDLKATDGKDVIYKLLRERDIDVVIENYRPGALASLGLGYEDVSELDNSIVYCSISGFGHSGPYKDRPALDPIAQAMSGVMHMTGNRDRKPSRVGASLIDYGTATNACFSILVALRNRDRTGEGMKVECSLYETAFAWAGTWAVNQSLYESVPERMGDKIENYAPVGAYKTSDGLIYLAIFGQSLWEKFCQALEIDSIHDDERFSTPKLRRENRAALDELIEKLTVEFDSETLLERLHEFEIPAAKIQSPADVIEDDHLHHRNMILESTADDGTTIDVPNAPQKFSGKTPEGNVETPDAGEDTGTVLRNTGYTTEEIADMVERGVIKMP